ncbi:cobalt-precorrin-5B (C(1))-methyltransferase [Desulfocurvus sp. DL9XJH121]
MAAPLREGFTTGTAAAAAAKAATLLLLAGSAPEHVDTPLPPGGRLPVPLDRAELKGPRAARGRVVKDAGDDPDVTHGHAVEALVELDPHGAPGEIIVRGGRGVGRVTLPGLPVPPGEAAINPAPRQQIRAAVAEALARENYAGAARVTVEIPDGEALAERTMNPRLGIKGGLSILGTRGTVKPFSHESYAASIRQALDVARAQGLAEMGLATGGRTEALLRADMPHLPPVAFTQFADFFSLALSEAAARGFESLTVGCYFGKLVKMAQSFPYTHAKDTRIDFALLARWFADAGLAPSCAARAAEANTARHALEIAWDDPAKDVMLELVTDKALKSARNFAGPGPRLDYRVYGFDGSPLIHRKGD